MYDEWRVVTRLLGPVRDQVIDEVWEATTPDTDVHRRGKHEIAIYAYTEEEARDSQTLLESVLAREGVPSESTLTRWNPGEERWQDPRLPVQPPRRRLEPVWIELGEMGWEVRIKTQDRRDARELERRLRDDGLPVYSDGWSRLTVGTRSEEEATELADELRLEVPLAEFRTRPLTRFRRWRIRQALLGGYGASPPDANGAE